MREYPQLETLYPVIESLCVDDYNELLKKMNLDQKDVNEAYNSYIK